MLLVTMHKNIQEKKALPNPLHLVGDTDLCARYPD